MAAVCQFSKQKYKGKMKCSSCSALFASFSNLKKHQKRFHENENSLSFACGLCPERFSSGQDLAVHRDQRHIRLVESDFRLRDSAHKRQSQSWRLVFPHDVDTMDRAFFYAW